MRIVFQKQDPQSILEAIQDKLDGRQLGKMVQFELAPNANLEVTIKKMGTSFLSFAFRDQGDQMVWDLSREKIALAHRAFRNEVMEKLIKIVTQVGGNVQRD